MAHLPIMGPKRRRNPVKPVASSAKQRVALSKSAFFEREYSGPPLPGESERDSYVRGMVHSGISPVSAKKYWDNHEENQRQYDLSFSQSRRFVKIMASLGVPASSCTRYLRRHR